ncbi:MAG: DUF3048 C-terminal domain-containing protein [Anaerolineae bacterium]|nr:DUF3048 C-terminal domain-containing protein [Anaerolineae bacterium]
MKLSSKYFLGILLLIMLLTSGCISTSTVDNTSTPTKTIPLLATTTTAPTQAPTTTITPTPQPRLTPMSYGPEIDNFPPGYNPLTGRAVQDPTLLDLPAVLVSISNIPVSARPQAGPGFAPWIFEYYIGEATTRFLGVFYGDYPRRIPNVTGSCPVRETIFTPTENWVGNRVWLDENLDGVQNAWETGVGGICVHLYNADSAEIVQSTSTNSNGFYAFDIPANEESYFIEFVGTKNFEFTHPNIGNDDQDSDADLTTGRTKSFRQSSADSSWDAGLLLLERPVATPSPVVTGTPPAWYLPLEAYVGPIRSGRLTYDNINKMFTNSCLVFAGAPADILAQLNPCRIVYGVDTSTPNSALLPVEEMRKLAEENKVDGQKVNYAGNLFSESLPNIAGDPATTISVYYHKISQSAWQYDPVSESYLRYTDNADGTGIFHPATDRLSGRQQAFENVIVLQAEHAVFRHNQLEIDLSMSQKGFAYLFRDGMVRKIYWSTTNREWEQKNGLLRPIHFEDIDKNPIALHPGRTWIHLVTPASTIKEESNGEWRIKFIQPYDPSPN